MIQEGVSESFGSIGKLLPRIGKNLFEVRQRGF